MEASVTMRAPAKLNLTLEVLARRADGLHGIRSLMVPIDLCDELTFSPSERFSFACDDPSLQAENIAERAAQAVSRSFDGTSIVLRKHIPAQAGLGGGSSDAAAVLLYAAQRAEGGAPDIVRAARSLGSDVPFFLAQTGALVEGAGERVTAVGALPDWHAVVVKPPAAIATKSAYEALDEAASSTRPRNASLSLEALVALQRHDFDALQALLSNDFERVVYDLAPPCAAARDALREAGAAHPLLAGSGSCVFALSRTARERDAIADGLDSAAGDVYRVAFARTGIWRAA